MRLARHRAPRHAPDDVRHFVRRVVIQPRPREAQAIADDALREVLVRRPDADLLDAVVLRRQECGGCERIIGFQLDHRPDGNPHGAQCLLQRNELGPQGALDAFARFDVEMALSVVREDKAVDMEYESAMRLMVTFMMEDPRTIRRALDVLWVARIVWASQ